MTEKIFRREAVENFTAKSHGSVVLYPNFSHSLLVGFVTFWIILAGIWVSFSELNQTRTVSGWLEPSTGIASAYAEGRGVVREVYVEEGDHVKKGQELMLIDAAQTLMSGADMNKKVIREYERQLAHLQEELQLVEPDFKHRLSELNKRREFLIQEVDLIRKQAVKQKVSRQAIEKSVDRASQLNIDGYISASEVDSLSIRLSEAQSREVGLERELVQKQQQISETIFGIQELEIQKKQRIIALEKSISSLEIVLTKAQAQLGYKLKADRSGVVENLQVKVGQQVDTSYQFPMLSIVPEELDLIAVVYVPTKSSGLINEGMKVNLRYDAYPHQEYGVYKGIVKSISRSAMLPEQINQSLIDGVGPAYKVLIDLNHNQVSGDGKNYNLKSGMTMEADIVVSRKTLLEKMLDPILSVTGKL